MEDNPTTSYGRLSNFCLHCEIYCIMLAVEVEFTEPRLLCPTEAPAAILHHTSGGRG